MVPIVNPRPIFKSRITMLNQGKRIIGKEKRREFLFEIKVIHNKITVR
jgi:hypothetical protein